MRPPLSPPALSQGLGALLDLAIANAQENPPETPRSGRSELCCPGMAGELGVRFGC